MSENAKTRGDIIVGEDAKNYQTTGRWIKVSRIHAKMIDKIQLQPGQKILDVGCGPGEVLLRLFARYGSAVEYHGVDPSADMIAIARESARERGVAMDFQEAAGERLPFADGEFDFAVSSLTFHHLPLEEKREALAEIHRVLKPHGKLLISDWGPPRGLLGRTLALINRNHSYTRENLSGVLPKEMNAAGFAIDTTDVQLGVYHHILARKT